MAIDELIDKLSSAIINPLILLMFAVALLVFLWGVFQFVSSATDLTAKADGKRHMLWGVIGMTIMVSALGIMQIIRATVNSLQ